MARFDKPKLPLADVVLSNDVVDMSLQSLGELRAMLASDAVHRVIANEVFQYCSQFTDGMEIIREMVTLAPPFRGMWIEGQEHPDLRFGIFCAATEKGQEGPPPDAALLARWGTEYRWSLDLTLFVDHRGIVRAPLDYCVLLNHDGQLFIDNEQLSVVISEHMEGMDEETKKGFFAHAFLPMMLTIAFMHCSNVHYDAMRFSPALEKQQQRAYGRPFLAYKTIRVVPFKSIHVPTPSETGEPRPWHMVRGHFADYRQRGLFGKHRGIFWVPEHGRGNRHIGEIRHDYEVMQPEKEHAK